LVARRLLDDVVTLHVDQDLRPVLRRHDTVEIGTPHAILAPSRVVRPSQFPTQFGAGHSALDFSEPFEVFPAVELQPYGFANVLHLDVEEVFEPHAIPRSGQLRIEHLTLHAGEGRSITDAQVREPSGGGRKPSPRRRRGRRPSPGPAPCTERGSSRFGSWMRMLRGVRSRNAW